MSALVPIAKLTAAMLVMSVLTLAPLALGSNRAFPWAYNATFSGIALVAVLLAFLFDRQSNRPNMGPIRWPLIVISLVVVWILIQGYWRSDWPVAHPIWSAADSDLHWGAGGLISINGESTRLALLRLLTALSVFLTAYLLGQNRNTAHRMLVVLIASAALYALVGLIITVTGSAKVLWYEVAPSGHVKATFINRNSAATYFGLTGLAALGLAAKSTHGTVSGQGIGSWFLSLSRSIFEFRSLFPLAVLVLILAALFATASRGGITAAIAGIFVYGLLNLVRVRRHLGGPSSPSLQFVSILAIIVLVVIIFELTGATFASRLLDSQLDSDARFSLYGNSLVAIGNHFWLGTGYGTFQDIYPLYSQGMDRNISDKAHNDYLELLLGLGVPGALGFLAAWVLMTKQILSGAFARRRDQIYPMVAVAATVLVAVHSLVDFSLQIQAVTLTYAVLMGLGAAQCTSSRAR